MKTITAQDLYNLTKCHHRVYLDSNGNPQEKGEVGSFVKLLWELGLQTEREYIESLGEMPVVDLGMLSVEHAFRETLRLMEEGALLIYQGCLIDGPYVGRPDLLFKREEGESRFGPYLYEAIDIKAGKGWERGADQNSKSIMRFRSCSIECCWNGFKERWSPRDESSMWINRLKALIP